MTMLMILAMAMVVMTEVWLVWLPTGLPDGEWAHLTAGGDPILHQNILAPEIACSVGAIHTAPEHPCTRDNVH